jgi:hypothetical protein
VDDERPAHSDWSVQLGEGVAACAARTLAARSAHIDVREVFNHTQMESFERRRRKGGLLRPAINLAKVVLKAGWKRTTRDLHFGRLAGEGVLEPSAERYMVDYGSWAVLYRDGEFYGGRSGRSLATLDPWRTFHRDELLWLLRSLRGTAEARVEGSETVRDTSCNKFAARVDLERASALQAGGLRAPAVDRFDDLHALPVAVWTDDRFIRRVQICNESRKELTLELWDFDVARDDLDWSRLPTFKSPEEAACYAGERASRRQRLVRSIRARIGGQRRPAQDAS